MGNLAKPTRFHKQWPRTAATFIETHLTDEQWQNINKYIELSATARAQVQEAINDYRFENHVSDTRPRPSDLKVELTRLANLAEDLKDGLSKPISQDIAMAVGAVDRTPGPFAHASYATHHQEICKQAEALLDILQKAQNNLTPKAPGADVTCINKLVQVLGDILFQHTGDLINRKKKTMSYVEQVFALADPDVGPGTIHEAVVRMTSKHKAS